MDIKKEVGYRLKKARLEAKLTQSAVAEEMGVHNSTIGKYELGEREADYQTVIKLASIYDVNVSWLMCEDLIDDKEPAAGFAFLGGPDEYTEEEKALARATIEAYRKMRSGNKKEK